MHITNFLNGRYFFFEINLGANVYLRLNPQGLPTIYPDIRKIKRSRSLLNSVVDNLFKVIRLTDPSRQLTFLFILSLTSTNMLIKDFEELDKLSKFEDFQFNYQFFHLVWLKFFKNFTNINEAAFESLEFTVECDLFKIEKRRLSGKLIYRFKPDFKTNILKYPVAPIHIWEFHDENKEQLTKINEKILKNEIWFLEGRYFVEKKIGKFKYYVQAELT